MKRLSNILEYNSHCVENVLRTVQHLSLSLHSEGERSKRKRKRQSDRGREREKKNGEKSETVDIEQRERRERIASDTATWSESRQEQNMVQTPAHVCGQSCRQWISLVDDREHQSQKALKKSFESCANKWNKDTDYRECMQDKRHTFETIESYGHCRK